MRPATFEMYFSGLQEMTKESKFCYDVIKGVKIEVKGQPNLHILVLAQNGYFQPLNPKNEKFYFFY